MGRLFENFDLRKNNNGDKIIVVSDNPRDLMAMKDKFQANGFFWGNDVKSWWMPANKMQSAIAALERINDEMSGGIDYDDEALFEFLDLEKNSARNRLYVVSDNPDEV